MSKRNPEIRLLMKILAVAGFIILLVLLGGYIFLRIRAPHLLEFAKGVEEVRIETALDSLENARFIQGMNGCENLWLDTSSQRVYVTTLDGYIHLLDGPVLDSLRVTRSFKAGTSVTGICAISNSLLAAVVNFNAADEWMKKGASVCLLPYSLDTLYRITEDFPAANGICMDSSGNLYLATSNFDFLDPEGRIMMLRRLSHPGFEQPETAIAGAGLANGLYYDPGQDKVLFSNTIGGVYFFHPEEAVKKLEYEKIRFMEACDDLCTDIAGNIWMTDPGYSTVKVYNPGTNRLVRFVIQGIGQTSSCRIRNENGMEVLYITELKKDQKPFSSVFDGRGVVRIPVNDLLRMVQIFPGSQ